MDIGLAGKRIKEVREKKKLTQEELAAMVDLSPTHISVIERGVKVPKIDTFVAIANALEVSSDELLIDSIEHTSIGVTDELSELIARLPAKQRKKIIDMVKVFVEE